MARLFFHRKPQTVPAEEYAKIPDESSGAPVKRRSPFKRFIKFLMWSILLVALAGVSWLGWKVYRTAADITGNNNPLQLVSILMPAKLKQTNGRTNVLLAGYSADDPGHSGAELTDSIMIVSLDAANKSAVIMSVPRDLYVKVPGHGHTKINAVYEYGEADGFNESGYSPGGMGLLEKTIKENLGIDINYYGLLNYAALRSSVDAVGGVNVTINSSDKRGVYDSNTGIKFMNGPVHLDGQAALNLSRARGDSYASYGFPGSDFDRTKYQQAILLALKDKVTTSGIISNPLKLGKLADSAGANYKTDMQLNEIQGLYRLTKNINNNQAKTIVFNNINGVNLLASYRTNDGQSALVPAAGLDKFGQLQEVLAMLLMPSSNN